AARMAGIEYPTRLDQQQLDLVFGVRLVLYTFRDDEHLARRQLDRPIAKIDPQSALQDDERLIRMLVIMPNEVALQPHELELVVVHFGYDLRLPLLVEYPELLAKIDRLVGHVASLSIETESSRVAARPRQARNEAACDGSCVLPVLAKTSRAAFTAAPSSNG